MVQLKVFHSLPHSPNSRKEAVSFVLEGSRVEEANEAFLGVLMIKKIGYPYPNSQALENKQEDQLV